MDDEQSEDEKRKQELLRTLDKARRHLLALARCIEEMLALL